MKDRNLFHLMNTIGNIFTRCCATHENITDGVHSMKLISIFHKKKQISSISSFLTIFSTGFYLRVVKSQNFSTIKFHNAKKKPTHSIVHLFLFIIGTLFTMIFILYKEMDILTV